MKRWPRWVLWLVGGLSVAVVAYAIAIVLAVMMFAAPTNDADNQNPAKQSEMVAITLEWGRLAPFPESAQDFTIITEGGVFTRAFRATFSAPEEDIRQWVAESPGLQDAVVDSPADGVTHYTIDPGGGAQWAEVTIDSNSSTVEVYVYWS